MAKKKKLSSKSAEACETLIKDGATKKDLARSLRMRSSTLQKRLDEHKTEQLSQENQELRAENERFKATTQDGKVIELKRKRAWYTSPPSCGRLFILS